MRTKEIEKRKRQTVVEAMREGFLGDIRAKT